MSWPNEHTDSFYIHRRTCRHCGTEFDGFSRSKYCSPHCIEMFKRITLMTKWGVPSTTIEQLLTTWNTHARP